MKINKKLETELLRKKAEELIKNNTTQITSQLSEVETLKLVHELEVHQIELEMQNDELILAKEREEIALNKYTELFDFAPSGYFKITKEGVINELNLFGAKMLGKERLRLKNSNFGFFVSEDTKPIFNLFLYEVFTHNTEQSCEIVLSPSNNPPRNVYLTGIVTENSDLCNVTVFEITEWKNTNKNIKENEKKYRALVENALEGMIILKLDGTVEFVNQALCSLFEFPNPDFIIGKKVFEFMVPESIQTAKKDFINIKKGIDSYLSQYHCFSLSGKDIWIESIGKMFLYEGTPSDIISIRDITERKQMEEYLSQSKRDWEDTFDSLTDMVTIHDKDYNIIHANKAGKELLKLPAFENFLNQKCYAYYHGTSEPPAGCPSCNCLKTGLPGVYELFEPHLNRDLEIRAIPRYDSNNELVGMIHIVRDITERKAVEEDLRQTNSFLQSIIDNIPNMVFIKSAKELRFIRLNHAGEDLLGIPEKEMLGKNDYDFFSKEQADFFLEKDREVLSSKKIQDITEEPLQTKNQGIRILHTKKVPILNTLGEPEYLLGISEDITERKSSEIALRNSEMHLRTLVQTIPDLIWLKDTEGVYLTCNPMFERFFGAKEAEIVGKTDYDFVDKKLADFFLEHDRKAMAAGKPTSNEEWITFADDGHCAYLETIKTPMFDSNGKLLGILGIGRDITKRKLVEEALRGSEEKYRNIFENVQDVFYQIDNQGIIIDISPSVTRLSDYLREDLIGTSMASLYYDPLEREILLKKLAKEGEIWDYEVHLNTKSGEVKVASINAHSMFDENNEHIGIEGTLRDISERKQMEIDLIEAKNRAEESDQLKTAFLANMSHEIRTPLNGIIGFSELLNDEDLSKEELKEFTSIIQISGKRLIEIVNNVLDISKIQTGQVKIDKGHILLNSMFLDLLAFFSPLTKAKNINLSYDNQLDNIITLYSDEIKLNQILMNLINNAIKFTESGSINFGYTVQNDIIQFYVKDTGIGIQEKLHDLIFDRFRQVEDSFTRTYEGAGLGLAICKGLVEFLGGKIWLESHKDKGSTFYFTIPQM